MPSDMEVLRGFENLNPNNAKLRSQFHQFMAMIRCGQQHYHAAETYEAGVTEHTGSGCCWDV